MAPNNREFSIGEAENIPIEVVYALPEKQLLKSLTVPAGSTVEQVIHYSGIMDLSPEIDFKKNRLGIFGKLVGLQTAVQAYDRVEVYRPLVIDPKEARKLRVKPKHKK